MARKYKKVMPAEAADATSNTSKVSDAPVEEEEDEVWDVVCVVPKNKSCECRTEGCSGQAVATWATNLEPEDKWNMCEKCQLRDFGGWPDNVEPDDDDDDEEQEAGVKDPQETGDKIDNKEHPSTESDPQDSSNPSTDPSKDVDTSIDSVKEDDNKSSDATPSPVDEPSQEEDDPTTNAASTDKSVSKNPASADVPPTAEAASSQVSNDPGNDAMETDESGNDAMETDETGNNNDNAMDTEAPSKETPEDSEDPSDNEAEEMWDLKKVLPLESIPSIKCSLETCPLPACCIWVSNLDPKTNWYSCLDCQQNDFGGWPVPEELPFNSLTPDHMRVIAAKCSRKKNPAMPGFPSETASPSTKEQSRANFVTPPPHSLANASQARAEVKGTNAAKITPPVGKPSKGALAMHKTWQDAAEAMGGKDVRIVVGKPAAKKLIFDKLYDAFCPMNITQIYKVRTSFVLFRKYNLSVPISNIVVCLSSFSFKGFEGHRSISCPQGLPSRHVVG
jgi:hypothetical protein